jgi:hypothetical protein
MRQRPTATALIKENDAVAFRVKELARRWGCPPTRTTVNKKAGLAVWVARLLEIHLMTVPHIEPAVVKVL